jgi:transcriptional regulator with XRE-family HTH domain
MLKETRETKNLSQTELAARLRITKGYLSKLEQHPLSCNPTVNIILRLSHELDLCEIKIFKYFIENRNYH